LLFAATVQNMVKGLKGREGDAALDLVVFYLDDGILAGDLRALAAALRTVEEEGARLGLQLNLGKCELVLPPGTSASRDDLGRLFPQSLLQDDEGNNRVLSTEGFDLLGMPIGSAAHCASYTSQVVKKAGRLLAEIGNLQDPQVALRLLRECGSHAKLTYNTRGTPADFHQQQLEAFDKEVRLTFARAVGVCPDDKVWKQATLGLKQAGLGLRSTARHAPAAYLASAASCQKLCAEVDPGFQFTLEDNRSHAGRALEVLNSERLPTQKLTVEAALRCKQKTLSQALDTASFEKLLEQASVAERTNLLSECQAGARDFLAAVPNQHLDLVMQPAEFTTTVKTRLGMTILAEDAWCPACDAVLDRKGYHAGMCCAGGDRTARHNELRNKVFNLAKAAALSPELEKPGLLLPAKPDDTSNDRRRPADLYLPAWLNGSPAALDFAVTAPQRQDALELASREALAAATTYSQTKRNYLQTDSLCREAGVQFQPMVCETTGAWALEAVHVLGHLARFAADATGGDSEALLARTLQQTSVAVRRMTARALLRRLSDC